MYSVSFYIRVGGKPEEYIKSKTIIDQLELIVVCDVEGASRADITGFETRLDCMIKGEKLKRGVKCKLAYSNLSFELWLLLHKVDFNRTLTSPDQYLKEINHYYQQNFQNAGDYKSEKNFQKLLDTLSIDEVCDAIKRAEKLMSSKVTVGARKAQYRKYSYYPDNPALSIHEYIKQILIECGLFQP